MSSTTKPGFEKSSPELVLLFDHLAPRGAGIVQKQMFGWPCCFLNGNLFLGLHKENILFRLPEADLAEFLSLAGASEFEPMPGRKMKGYGLLASPLKRERKLLAQWIARSLDLARSLPAKNAALPKETASPKRNAKKGTKRSA